MSNFHIDNIYFDTAFPRDARSIQITHLSLYVSPGDTDSIPARFAALLQEAVDEWKKGTSPVVIERGTEATWDEGPKG
jgi:hypothetical protein